MQKGQTTKNCRIELEKESNQSIDGKQSTQSHYQEAIIRGMAETCTELLPVTRRRVGNVAVGVGGTLLSPPLSVDQVKRYIGDVKGFPEIDELIDIIQNGVPVNSRVTNLDPTRVLQYGNHTGVREHMDLEWEKLFVTFDEIGSLCSTEVQRRRSRAYVWHPLVQLLHTK